MADFNGFVLHPGSGEVALNMKLMIEDALADSRRRQSNASDFDKAMNNFTLASQQDAQTLKYLATVNNLTSDQTGQTENQQTVSPVRTGTGDAIVGGVGVSAEAVAASIGQLATAAVSVITATGGVVTAQSLAAILPILVNSIGGASTPSQTQAKPTT